MDRKQEITRDLVTRFAGIWLCSGAILSREYFNNMCLMILKVRSFITCNTSSIYRLQDDHGSAWAWPKKPSKCNLGRRSPGYKSLDLGPWSSSSCALFTVMTLKSVFLLTLKPFRIYAGDLGWSPTISEWLFMGATTMVVVEIVHWGDRSSHSRPYLPCL